MSSGDGWPERREVVARLSDEIGDHRRDHPSRHFVDGPAVASPCRHFRDLAGDRAGELHGRQSFDRQKAGAQAVVDVMREIGDIVREARDLRFRVRPAVEFEALPCFDAPHGLSDRVVARDRTIVFGKALERFPGEVQPVEVQILPFERRDDADRLRVMVEAAEAAHGLIERPFARVPERRVAEIVRESQRFGQVFVQPQLPGDGARDLRHFERVRQPRPEVIAFVKQEHLRLVGQTPEGGRMQNAVAVTLEGRARRAISFAVLASARGNGACRIGRGGSFAGLKAFAIIAHFRCFLDFACHRRGLTMCPRPGQGLNAHSPKGERLFDRTRFVLIYGEHLTAPSRSETPRSCNEVRGDMSHTVTVSERAAKRIAEIAAGDPATPLLANFRRGRRLLGLPVQIRSRR